MANAVRKQSVPGRDAAYTHEPNAQEELGGALGIGDTEGSTTGEGGESVQAGGWEGTDDATSTAPSDLPAVEEGGPDELDTIPDESGFERSED